MEAVACDRRVEDRAHSWCWSRVRLTFVGCAPQRIAFTQGIRTHYGLGSEDLKNLQYYVSSDITLQRDFRREEGEISKNPQVRGRKREGSWRRW